MLGKTSWYPIDFSGNDRHILLFYKKCHFCHLLLFAEVYRSIVKELNNGSWNVAKEIVLNIDVPADRHILLFYKKFHFCHLLLFAEVYRSIVKELNNGSWNVAKEIVLNIDVPAAQ